MQAQSDWNSLRQRNAKHTHTHSGTDIVGKSGEGGGTETRAKAAAATNITARIHLRITQNN